MGGLGRFETRKFGAFVGGKGKTKKCTNLIFKGDILILKGDFLLIEYGHLYNHHIKDPGYFAENQHQWTPTNGGFQ